MIYFSNHDINNIFSDTEKEMCSTVIVSIIHAAVHPFIQPMRIYLHLFQR